MPLSTDISVVFPEPLLPKSAIFSPEFVDYHWVAQGDIENRFGKGFTKQLKSVILNLDINQKSHKQILDMFNAKRFINAEAKHYKNIEEIGRKLNKIR